MRYTWAQRNWTTCLKVAFLYLLGHKDKANDVIVLQRILKPSQGTPVTYFPRDLEVKKKPKREPWSRVTKTKKRRTQGAREESTNINSDIAP
jgi:hypothetical protein